MQLMDIIIILRKKIIPLITIPLFFMLAAGLISYYLLIPVYQTSTTLMINTTYINKNYINKNNDNENNPLLQLNDILTANQLVQTYTQIAKSNQVANQVITVENLNITPQEFIGKIHIQPIKNTQLINITVTDTNPYQAARLANTTARVFMNKVVEIMKVENVNVIDPALVPQTPIKPNKTLNIIIAGICGLFISISIIFLLESFNQTTKNT